MQAKESTKNGEVYNTTRFSPKYLEGDTTIVAYNGKSNYQLKNEFMVGIDAVEAYKEPTVKYPQQNIVNAMSDNSHYKQLYKGAEKANITTKKEATMPKTNDITIQINGEAIDLYRQDAAVCFKPKPKTELEAKLPFAMVVYSVNGDYESIHYNATRKGVKKRKNKYLQKPANLGKTVTLHEVFGEFTTAIPVVEVQ